VYFRLPETGGFSFAELDILFANKVSARRFKHVTIHDELAAGETKGESTDRDGTDTEKGDLTVNEKDVVQGGVYHLDS
jgi:SP family general alpha glucoside:H+ symporter-like MFS transporter